MPSSHRRPSRSRRRRARSSSSRVGSSESRDRKSRRTEKGKGEKKAKRARSRSRSREGRRHHAAESGSKALGQGPPPQKACGAGVPLIAAVTSARKSSIPPLLPPSATKVRGGITAPEPAKQVEATKPPANSEAKPSEPEPTSSPLALPTLSRDEREALVEKLFQEAEREAQAPKEAGEGSQEDPRASEVEEDPWVKEEISALVSAISAKESSAGRDLFASEESTKIFALGESAGPAATTTHSSTPLPVSATAAARNSGLGDDDDEDLDASAFDRLLNYASSVATAQHGEQQHPAAAPPEGSESDELEGNAPGVEGPVLIDSEDDGVLEELERRAKQKSSGLLPKEKALKKVDHSKIAYQPFEKDFYIIPEEQKRLTPEELRSLRLELDGARVWGANPPPPMKTWSGIGLHSAVLDALHRAGFAAPFAIQSLAIPALMSGRDLLATAKTGSGKTLAYLLPMLRHVFHQPRCLPGEGPIGLILVPTHELAHQVYQTCVQFAGGEASGLRVCSSYGGTSLRENIAHCKTGCELMVATPGRLLDLLVANRGRVLQLSRVTFAVIDEADRMLDEGFGPHVAAFLRNIRPDCQTCMVSATMPREVRSIAKKLLKNPVEISVGGRPSPSHNVKQTVFVFDRPSSSEGASATELNADRMIAGANDLRWLKLLQILGEKDVNERLVLIFVGVQEDCDEAAARLMAAGYVGKVGTLYCGMDQLERELALKRFAKNDRPLLIATGVAERGLDIVDLDLVINYAMPDHYESYVNRIGRTGRAGRKGTAITFFTKGTDDAMAAELIAALEESGNEAPEELHLIAMQQQQQGTKSSGAGKWRKSNFAKGFRSGRSYRFNAREREAAKALGLSKEDLVEEGDDDIDSDDEVKRRAADPQIVRVDDSDSAQTPSMALTLFTGGQLMAGPPSMEQQARIKEAQKYADMLTQNAQNAGNENYIFQSEYEINDLPKKIRSRLQSHAFLAEVSHDTDTSIVVKGRFVDDKHRGSLLHKSAAPTSLKPGERRLYLQIRGKDERDITRVFRAFDQVADELAEKLAKRTSAFGVKLPSALGE